MYVVDLVTFARDLHSDFLCYAASCGVDGDMIIVTIFSCTVLYDLVHVLRDNIFLA